MASGWNNRISSVTSGRPDHTIARDRVGDIRGVEPLPEAQFEAIYRLTYQKTLAYLRRRSSNMSDAVDVASDTYLVTGRRLTFSSRLMNPKPGDTGSHRRRIKRHRIAQTPKASTTAR